MKLVRSARGEEKKARALAPATQGACGASHCGGGAFKQDFPAKQPTPPLPLPRLPKPLAWRQGPRPRLRIFLRTVDMVDIYCLDIYIFTNSRSYIIKLNLELPEYVIPTAATATA